MRSDGDLVTIERSLGLKSERGISRQGNKDNPIIQELLADIKTIALKYTEKPNTEIRASTVLEQESLELFKKFGSVIWPAAGSERPNWLAEPSTERYDGKYPRALHHDVPEENKILSELFHALVVEKCVKYHDNQLQKARRLTRKSEVADYEQEGVDAEFHGSHVMRAYSENHIDPRSPASSPASIPHGLPYSDDPDNEMGSQDEGTSSDGSDSRAKTERLQHYRDEIARASESYLHATDGNMDSGRKRRRKHGQDTSSKRIRETSDGDAPQSLIVHLQVNPEALSRLVTPKSVQRPDMSHRDSTHGMNRNEHNIAASKDQVDANANAHQLTAPPSTIQLDQSRRRSSGFQPINAMSEDLTATAEHVPVSAPDHAASNHMPPAGPVQPLDGPSQPPTASEGSAAVHPSTLRIVSAEPLADGQQLSVNGREQQHPELSDQSYTTAQTSASRRNSTHAQDAVNHVRDQLGMNRQVDLAQPAPSLQKITTHQSPVQPLTLQPPATFRDPSHGHHAFRVARPFVPQPQQHQQQNHHTPPQHHHSQHQLQHQFVAHPPVQHGGQRQIAPQQQAHLHQHGPPRQLLPANNYPTHQQAPPVRRPSPRQIFHSHVRRNTFAEEILGDLLQCPVVTQILAADSNLDRQQLNNLKTILTNHPETRNDMEVLLKRMNSLMDPSPARQQQNSPNPNMRGSADIGHPVGNASHLQQGPMPAHSPPIGNSYPQPLMNVDQSPRMKSEPTEEDKLMSSTPHPASFENVSVEINWGRQLEFSDYMEMQYCHTTKEFFSLVEAHLPDEISADGAHIKEIRVKALKELKGGNLLPRIVRDEARGRAAIRHLFKRLRAQPPDSEPELMFVVVWEDKIGA